ncbi:DUF2207 domain-containing protein [Sulfurovum sp.]|uniref:DUF2207 domain-containing protein n=1 Tax=Sulfurovum sp. TaxID=1969726 RepID=UPI002867F6A8|nr:DUF2207 domain-containing protein [Sulfurovum sp.]
MKKLLLFTLLFLGCGSSAYAEKISNYKIDITVEQSGELSIVEYIEYDFEAQSKHGIFRDIPFTIKGESHIKDLGLYNFSAQLDDGIVEWKQSTLGSIQAGDVLRLQIGSASTYLTGKHLYTIAYRVKRGVLPASKNEKNDAIRWNIVGTGWQIPIYNIEANFFLPSSLSQQNIALSTYTGSYGTQSSRATNIWINPRQLQIKVSSLNPHEGTTVELAYPADTLEQNGLENVKASFADWIIDYWHWGVLVGFLLYFRKMYSRYAGGFTDERSVAIQYEAPKGLSVLQSGLMLDKFTDNEDFAAAVLELAQLGHLEIDQKEKNLDPLLMSKENDTKNLTADQKYLLEHVLFKSKNIFTFSSGSSSKATALQEGFEHINDTLYIWSVVNGYMLENPQRVRKNFLGKSILFLLPVTGLTFYTLFLKFGEEAAFLLLFPLMFGIVGLGIMISKKNWLTKITGFLFAAVGTIPLLGMHKAEELVMGPMGVLILLAAALFFTYKKIGKFTQKGAYAAKHLLGLKEFVNRVKEDEIKRRLVMDPLYLEKMLPYAVLFNQTEHWLSFYDILNVKEPHWYHGSISGIGRFSSAVNTASTLPSKSSSGGGGFSGGGGSSGGGGGGGGGGSW